MTDRYIAVDDDGNVWEFDPKTLTAADVEAHFCARDRAAFHAATERALQALRDEAAADAKAQGAAAERARITALQRLCVPGAEDMVAAAIASGASPDRTAGEILRAQQRGELRPPPRFKLHQGGRDHG